VPRKRAVKEEKKDLTIDWGEVSPKQQEFLDADTFFVCYGGA